MDYNLLQTQLRILLLVTSVNVYETPDKYAATNPPVRQSSDNWCSVYETIPEIAEIIFKCSIRGGAVPGPSPLIMEEGFPKNLFVVFENSDHHQDKYLFVLYSDHFPYRK